MEWTNKQKTLAAGAVALGAGLIYLMTKGSSANAASLPPLPGGNGASPGAGTFAPPPPSGYPSTTNYPNDYTTVPGTTTGGSSVDASTSRGDPTVQYYQQALAQLGYDPGPIDGRSGPLTSNAVRDFQRDNNLTVDGILGPRTKAAIDAATGTPAPTSGFSPRRGRYGRWKV